MIKRFTQPQHWQWGIMTNADHADLRYGVLARHDNPVANIVIAPGLSEFSHKYFETARILSRLGYNIYVLHWRGQGGSAPYLTDRFRRHSLGFDRDARDLLQFTNNIVPARDTPKILLAHSMGGLISTLAVLAAPGQFRAVILSAPLFGLQTPLRQYLEPLLAWIPFTRTCLENYMPGGGPWVKRTDPSRTTSPESFSSDPRRNTLHDAFMEADPSLRIGSPTLGFVQEASRSVLSLRRKGVAESITTPMLIFSAGQDEIVHNTPIFNLAARLPHGQHMHLPTAKHEILLEQDAIRRPVFKRIHSFIMSNLG